MNTLNESISIGVIGASGKMGLEIARMLAVEDALTATTAMDTSNTGEDWGNLAGAGANGIKITSSIENFLEKCPQVVVDVSTGAAAAENIPKVLGCKIPAVIGATGISSEEVESIGRLAEANGVCCMLIPNFSIGANLMIALARKAAPYFFSAEIIEKHHPAKRDAPSGTAMFTLSEIVAANPKLASPPSEHEVLEGSRGGLLDDVRIHSVRLPGILAEQSVIFGGPGETLEITHRSIGRECFMPGVIWAVKYAFSAAPGLIIGLDQALGLT